MNERKPSDMVQQLAIENGIAAQAVETMARIKFPSIMTRNQPLPMNMASQFFSGISKEIKALKKAPSATN